MSINLTPSSLSLALPPPPSPSPHRHRRRRCLPLNSLELDLRSALPVRSLTSEPTHSLAPLWSSSPCGPRNPSRAPPPPASEGRRLPPLPRPLRADPTPAPDSRRWPASAALARREGPAGAAAPRALLGQGTPLPRSFQPRGQRAPPSLVCSPLRADAGMDAVQRRFMFEDERPRRRTPNSQISARASVAMWLHGVGLPGGELLHHGDTIELF
ncbi:hypothetical protein PVAP13_1NG192200 [Panicum virgatum]|uniref:Uncharacterized protein n=1 Tax=Panicum virgatum TaxID=38727 RepID=A0A8T0X5P7_PANVG|nr:hypothetical protein PVAP13_1NG192200 [Panicum virgatum]